MQKRNANIFLSPQRVFEFLIPSSLVENFFDSNYASSPNQIVRSSQIYTFSNISNIFEGFIDLTEPSVIISIIKKLQSAKFSINLITLYIELKVLMNRNFLIFQKNVIVDTHSKSCVLKFQLSSFLSQVALLIRNTFKNIRNFEGNP